jgi:hypothetical protein
VAAVAAHVASGGEHTIDEYPAETAERLRWESVADAILETTAIRSALIVARAGVRFCDPDPLSEPAAELRAAVDHLPDADREMLLGERLARPPRRSLGRALASWHAETAPWVTRRLHDTTLPEAVALMEAARAAVLDLAAPLDDWISADPGSEPDPDEAAVLAAERAAYTERIAALARDAAAALDALRAVL